MHNQVFADGLGQISVIGGTVRLDFVSYSPVEKDASGRPVAVFCHQTIMGIDAFLAAAEKIHEAANAVSNRVSHGRPREAHPAAEAVAAPPAVAPAAVAPPAIAQAAVAPAAVASSAPEPVAAVVEAPRTPVKPPFP